MAKLVKKKKQKRFRLEVFAPTVFFTALVLNLVSSLFLRSANNSLSLRAQQLERQIAQLQVENDAVSVEVNSLNTRDRVTGIAAEDGLKLDQDNIITITKNPSEGE